MLRHCPRLLKITWLMNLQPNRGALLPQRGLAARQAKSTAALGKAKKKEDKSGKKE
jgi:hypothetical protein